MSEIKRARQACALGIKALHNVRDASIAFEKLSPILYRRDNVLLSSLLHYGVVKYSKPFVQSNYKDSKVVYPVKSIKDSEGFSLELHDHLIEIRNTLIAHDDFNEIEPKVIAASLKPDDLEISIPVVLTITNKSISHPATADTCNQFATHSRAAFEGIKKKLKNDLKLYRELIIKSSKNEVQSEPLSSSPIDSLQLSETPSQISVPPEAYAGIVTAPATPSFSEIHDGFVYNEAVFEHGFYGPETINLPDGSTIELTPNGDPDQEVESEYYTSHPSIERASKSVRVKKRSD